MAEEERQVKLHKRPYDENLDGKVEDLGLVSVLGSGERFESIDRHLKEAAAKMEATDVFEVNYEICRLTGTNTGNVSILAYGDAYRVKEE